MSYLQCPECRLTVPAAAYYLRGDECPRCLTPMRPADRVTRATTPAPPPAMAPVPSAPAPAATAAD